MGQALEHLLRHDLPEEAAFLLPVDQQALGKRDWVS